MQYPGLYVHFEPGNLMLAGGCYQPDKECLWRIRRYIVEHPEEVEAALADKDFMDIYGGLAEGEKNKILPKEFKSYGDSHPLIFNKQYYYSRTYEDESLITSPDLRSFVLRHYQAGKSWNDIVLAACYPD